MSEDNVIVCLDLPGDVYESALADADSRGTTIAGLLVEIYSKDEGQDETEGKDSEEYYLYCLFKAVCKACEESEAEIAEPHVIGKILERDFGIEWNKGNRGGQMLSRLLKMGKIKRISIDPHHALYRPVENVTCTLDDFPGEVEDSESKVGRLPIAPKILLLATKVACEEKNKMWVSAAEILPYYEEFTAWSGATSKQIGHALSYLEKDERNQVEKRRVSPRANCLWRVRA